jgi:hypothetical protein
MNGLQKAIQERKKEMAHKLDCTEKAWEIMLKHTTWRKPKKLTSKRQAYIDILMKLGQDGKYTETH